jgi:hypothetical protein
MPFRHHRCGRVQAPRSGCPPQPLGRAAYAVAAGWCEWGRVWRLGGWGLSRSRRRWRETVPGLGQRARVQARGPARARRPAVGVHGRNAGCGCVGGGVDMARSDLRRNNSQRRLHRLVQQVPGSTTAELAECVGKSLAATARALKRLRARGLVRRDGQKGALRWWATGRGR